MGRLKEKIDELADGINKLGSNDKNVEQCAIRRKDIGQDIVAARTNLIDDIANALVPYLLSEEDIRGFELYINDVAHGDLLLSIANSTEFVNALAIKLRKNGFRENFANATWLPRQGVPPEGIQTTLARPGICFHQLSVEQEAQTLAKASVSALVGVMAQTSYTLDPLNNNKWNIGRGPRGNEGVNNIVIRDEGDDVLVVSRSHAYIAYTEQNGFMIKVYNGGLNNTSIFRNDNCVKELRSANLFPLEHGDEIELCNGVIILRFEKS